MSPNLLRLSAGHRRQPVDLRGGRLRALELRLGGAATFAVAPRPPATEDSTGGLRLAFLPVRADAREERRGQVPGARDQRAGEGGGGFAKARSLRPHCQVSR